MSIKAFPLNQTEYSYNAQDVMKYYAGRNSGVFETGDNLKVSANGGLELRVNTGMGWLAKDYVASVAFWNESVEYLMVDAGHDTYNRIDLVVVSWNFIQQEQNPKLIIRKGTPASSPAVPSLVNDSSTIEIALARINVAKGAITLSDSNIVDLRGNDTYCPMVYDEQTIRNAFVNCVGYADGVKKISDFPSATPTANDKLLIENGGTGKSTTIVNAVNTCSLTLEEIQASTDLSGKIASASGLKELSINVTHIENAIYLGVTSDSNDFSFVPRNIGEGVYIVFSSGGVKILGILHRNNSGYGFLCIRQNGVVGWISGSLDDTVTVYVGEWYSNIYARRLA